MRGILRPPVNSLHQGPVTGKMFPSGDVIMNMIRYSTVRLWPLDATRCRRSASTSVHIIVCLLFVANTLPKPKLTYSQLDPTGKHHWTTKLSQFSFQKMYVKISSAKYRPFVHTADTWFRTHVQGRYMYFWLIVTLWGAKWLNQTLGDATTHSRLQ